MTTYAAAQAIRDCPWETVLAEWDGCATAAIGRDHTGEDQLLWMLWDHAPGFEIWLRMPLLDTEVKQLTAEPLDILSEFVVARAGRETVLDVFAPHCDDPTKSVTTVPWVVPDVNESQLAVEAAQKLADVIAQTPLLYEPSLLKHGLLLEVAQSMADYASATA
jgi:hypothetical protein